MPATSFLRALADSILAGEASVDEITDRLALTLGRRWRWLRPLARRYVIAFAGRTRPREREVAQFLNRDPGLGRAWTKYSQELVAVSWTSEAHRMQPAPAASAWSLPPIELIGDLAAWLGLDAGDLFWFADLRDIGSRTRNPRLRHYHYRVLAKSSGNLRLIEAPKHRLKDIQHTSNDRLPGYGRNAFLGPDYATTDL